MSTPPYIAGPELAPSLQQDAKDLMRRLVGHVQNGTTDLAPAQYPEPAASYRDPALWERETRSIHRRVPLPLALSSELVGPGSYKAVDVMGTPVLLTRDKEGVIHASVNACRHRGSELLPAGVGTTRRITCPYHAWTYGLDGCLLGVTAESTFGPVDREAMSLLTLPVAERAGFVFVCLDATASIDLDAWLGEVAPLLDGLGLESCHHHSTTHLPGPNWKLVVDGYLEGYHFAALHPTTVSKTNYSNMATFDAYGPHMRVAFALRTIDDAVGRPEEEWEPSTSVGPILWLFPGIAIAGGWRRIVQVSIVLPGTTVGASITEQHVLLRSPPVDDEETKVADNARDWFYEVTLDEDYNTAEGVQRGLEALGDTDLVFGRNEPGVQHFHRTVSQALTATQPD